MGRPKKEEAKGKPEEKPVEAMNVKVEDMDCPIGEMARTEWEKLLVAVIQNTPPVDLKHLKECPKCGEKCTGPYKDKHGLYRCNCSHPKCGFWDSVISETPEEAARLWQLAGGPNPSLG
jgi:hypothetical protein